MSKPKLYSTIQYFGKTTVVACDGNCTKAWGVQSRPTVQLSDDPDDHAFLPDSELGDAPADPGTYEGGHGKPRSLRFFPNKWCVRECERSDRANTDAEIRLRDFSRRVYNMPHKHPEAVQ